MLKIKDFENKILSVKPNTKYFYDTEAQDIVEVEFEDESFLEKYPSYPQQECFMQIKAHVVDLNAIGMDLIKDFVSKSPNKEIEAKLNTNDASLIFNLISKDPKLLGSLTKMMHADDNDKLYALAKRYVIPLNPTFEFRRLARKNYSLKYIAKNIRHIAETSYVHATRIKSTETNFKLEKRLYYAGYYFEAYYLGIINEPDHASFKSFVDVAYNYIEASQFMMKHNGVYDPEKKVDKTDSYIEILFNDIKLKDKIPLLFKDVEVVIDELPEWEFGIPEMPIGYRFGLKVYEKPLKFREDAIRIGQVLGKTKDRIKRFVDEFGNSVKVSIVDVTYISPYVECIPDIMTPQKMAYYSNMGVFYRREFKIV